MDVFYRSEAERNAILLVRQIDLDKNTFWKDTTSGTLPEPMHGWKYTNVAYRDVKLWLFGYDFEAAVAYLEEVKAYAKAMGYVYELPMLGEWKIDEDTQIISYDFIVRPLGGIARPYRLVYDPNDPECPCKLIS